MLKASLAFLIIVASFLVFTPVGRTLMYESHFWTEGFLSFALVFFAAANHDLRQNA